MQNNMENEMETGIVGFIGVLFWLHKGYSGIMEKTMDTTKMSCIDNILGLYWGYIAT